MLNYTGINWIPVSDIYLNSINVIKIICHCFPIGTIDIEQDTIGIEWSSTGSQ